MAEPISSREITLTRIYDAPRDEVWAMWTEADHIKEWWGPDGFSVGAVESDPRPGGVLTIVMVGPEFEQTMRARYSEVDVGQKLVVESVVHTPDGEPFIDSAHVVTFRSLGERTEVTVNARASVFDPAGLGALAGMKAGWNQSLQCLDDALRGVVDRQIVLMRLFDAPTPAVFALWTDESHLERWWGPDGFTISVDEFDAGPGGRWRFTMHGPDGTDHPNLIDYDEIVPDERLVYTRSNPADPSDPPFRSIVTFDDLDGKTVLSLRNVFESTGARDLVVEKYHAIEGGNQTLARLGALLAAAQRPSGPRGAGAGP